MNEMKGELRAILKEQLLRNNKANSSYSMRALARDLGFSPSFMSQFFSGKKSLSSRSLELILKKNTLDDDLLKRAKEIAEKNKLVPKSIKKSVRENLNHDNSKLLCDWDTINILSLLDKKRNGLSLVKIASSLSLDHEKVIPILNKLLLMKVIIEYKGNYVRTNQSMSITNEDSKKYIRKFHKKALSHSLESIDGYETYERILNALVIPSCSEKFEEVKKEMKLFCNRIEKIATNYESNDVFQLSVQFVPVKGKSKCI